MGHLLIENRHGPIVGTRTTHATGRAEREAAEATVGQLARGGRRITLGSRQGFRRGGACRGAARDRRHPARGEEPLRPTLGHRRAHHPPSRLRRQPAHSQADRNPRTTSVGGTIRVRRSHYGGPHLRRQVNIPVTPSAQRSPALSRPDRPGNRNAHPGIAASRPGRCSARASRPTRPRSTEGRRCRPSG